MESFLDALTPTLRESVRSVMEAYGEAALEMVVERYITEDGEWPTNRETATFLAYQFLDNYHEITVDLDDYTPPRFGGSGLASTTVAGLVGGALSVGAAKGAVVLSSKLMGRYWSDLVGYATGMNPAVVRGLQRTFNAVARDTGWSALAGELMSGRAGAYTSAFGGNFQQQLEREMLGIFARSAWRGARSAVHNTGGTIGNPAEAAPWVQNYVQTFAANQAGLTERTMAQLVNSGLDRGLSERVLGRELRDYWTLTPQHARAVENYRRGLAHQERTVTGTRRLTRAYADRLSRSRVEAMARTEVLTTFNLGRELQWKQAIQRGELPANTVKMWVTAQDELVCKVCRPLDGMTTELGTAFETDQATLFVPTAHPNCRCLIIPVEDDSFPDISKNKKLVFARDLVEKRTIIVPEYEREDGTRVRRHTRRLTGDTTYADVASWLNSLSEETVSLEDLQERLGDEEGELVFDGINNWAASFDNVSHLRKMLDGEIEPGSARKMRANDESLLALDGLVRQAPSNAPKLYRGMKINAPMDDVKAMFQPGQSFDPTIASFSSSKEIANSYSASQAWNFLRFGRKSVEIELSPGARGVHIEPVSRNLPSLLGDLDEWVVSGPFEVTGVKQTSDNHLRVQMKPSGVSKSRAGEVVSALLEWPFYALSDEVSKRTILVPEYEREDGTKVRRHTRVIGERDAVDRWRDAPATKDHEKIAEFFNTYNFPEVPHSKILDVEKPSSYPEKPATDDEDLKRKFSEWRTKVEAWWDTEDGKKYTWDLRAAENRWYSSVAQEAIKNASESVDREVLKSALFGSRIWTTQTDGVGLVRQLSGMTDYPTHRDVDLSSYRESKIRAASDFLNIVRSAPPTKKDLYRGVKIADEHRASLRDMKKVGGTLNLPVSSFTEDRYRGEGFMGQYMIEKGYTPVLFTLKNSNALRLPNETSNRLYAESEFVTSGEFTIDEVELPTEDDRAYRITISPVGVSKAKPRYGYIEDALCTPLPLPWRRTDEISKRTITISEYLRGDGTRVEEHERKIGGTDSRVEEFLNNFALDGELSTHESVALGSAATLALAIASRGRLRRRFSPSIYKDFTRTKDGLVPSTALRESLEETFQFTGSRYSTQINSIRIGDQPHHSVTFEAIRETLGEGNNVARAFSRTFARRNNIRVEGRVVNRDGLTVGEFDMAIDPRSREAFQYGLFLNKGVQGKGFASEFTTHLGKRYLDTGIERVGALASGSVGGYAWAQRGFDWRYGPSIFVHQGLKSAASGQHTNLGRQPAAVMKEIEVMRRRLAMGHLTRKFPSPQEVANIGRSSPFTHPETGAQTWAGREIMMGTQWHASLDVRSIRNLLKKEGVIKSWFEDDVAKNRTVTVREHTRGDGTVVEEHERKIKGSSNFLGYEGPGASDLADIALPDLSSPAAQTAAAVTLVAAGIATRGLFRQAAPLRVQGSWKSSEAVASWARGNQEYLSGLGQWVGGGSRNFRQYIEGFNQLPSDARRWDAFARGLDAQAARTSAPKLYRGMTVPRAGQGSGIESFTLSAESLRVGHTFDMAPSSFSRWKSIANDFTKSGSAKHGDVRVVMNLERGSKSARIADVSPMIWEREYVSWGSYQITNVVQRASHTEVTVRQTRSYSLADTRAKNAARQPSRPSRPPPKPASPPPENPFQPPPFNEPTTLDDINAILQGMIDQFK